jgi:hypothetical protein
MCISFPKASIEKMVIFQFTCMRRTYVSDTMHFPKFISGNVVRECYFIYA